MKYKYTILIAVFVFGATTVYALPENSGDVGGIRAKLASTTKDMRQTAKDDIQKARDVAKAELEQKKVDNMRNVFRKQANRVVIRLQATIDRIQNIMTRVLSRIEKIKNAGGDTTKAEKYVSDAKVSFDKAKASFNLLQNAGTSLASTTDITNMTASSTATILKGLKDMSKDVEKNLQQTQKSLEKAVGSLKGLSQLAPNATTTKNN